ncbi:hypothetical protein [Shewanella sp. MBTL60-007]|uniref:hypothetical protein n=1 Tax=Shewanella sp. MBTL60-007 TaxID=2815911 RepID=UPI001BBDF157|nr:hypothetical protein [Shewanella sp. MBTL60-007]GIU32789.1 hypothetical protein TUM3792_45480 [Shewanella sp. MBTL60-007]
MQSSERRWAYFYDFNLKPHPEGAPFFELDEVLSKVEQTWRNGQAVHKYRNKELTIRVKDFKKVKDYALLLIHVSDIKATDPAFSNVATGEVRVEAKKVDEGIGAACHVIFSRKTIGNKKGWYLSIIEEVVGIPKSTIEQFLTYLFRESCSTNYKKEGSKSKTGNICRPLAVFNGHASSTLKESLSHSSLQGITLLNHNEGGFIDDNQELKMSEQVIRLSVIGAPSGNQAIDLIKKAASFGKKSNYDEVRVQYVEVVAEEKRLDRKGKATVRSVKKQRTLPFSAKEADVANLLFTKSELIELKQEIGQCEDTIHSELANKMKSLLAKAIK